MKTKTIARLMGALVVAAFVSSCGGGSDFQPRDLAYSYVEGDFYGDWPVQVYAARTRPEWIAIWDHHDPLQYPPPDMPEVDFSAYTVAGISLGWGASGCHGMAIDQVREEESQVRVTYRRVLPGPLMICTASLVPLVAFLKIPATTKPVLFNESGA